MAKKRKKKGLSEHQRNKIEEAQRRKTYLKRLLGMLRYLGYDDIIEMLNEELLEEFWRTRTALVRINLSQAKHFTKQNQQYIQRELYHLFGIFKAPLPDKTGAGREILLSDFYEIWLPMTITIGHDSEKPSEIKIKTLLREAMKKYGISYLKEESGEGDMVSLDILNIFSQMDMRYRSYLLTFALQFNNPCIHFFWIGKMEYETINGRVNREITFFSSDPVAVVGPGIKDSRRYIYRVGFPILYEREGEIKWLSAKIPRNPYIHFNPDAEYEVYIQEHAIKRLFERVDGVFSSTVNVYMNLCFMEWKTDWYKGSLLISYDLHQQRVGYFVADLSEDKKIIIRTFYFITYDRTPEGEALSSYAGLQALDKKYLGIDRLSTFLASNLDKDSKFAAICREAGLGHLLNSSALRCSVDFENKKVKSISNEFIAKYLSTLQDD